MQDEAFAIGQLQRNVKWKLVRLHPSLSSVLHSFIEETFFQFKEKRNVGMLDIYIYIFSCNNYVTASSSLRMNSSSLLLI